MPNAPQRIGWDEKCAIEQPPTLGRIVHYTSSRLGDSDGRKAIPYTYAAIITKVGDSRHDTTVDLLILYPNRGQVSAQDVALTEELAGSEAARGKWTYPARVDGEALETRGGEVLTTRRDANDTDSDVTKVMQALNVLFDNRHKRGVPETEDDVNDIRHMCLTVLGKILAEKSNA